MQLLRRQIGHQLHSSCKFDSKFLTSALQTANELVNYDSSFAIFVCVIDNYLFLKIPSFIQLELVVYSLNALGLLYSKAGCEFASS